MASRNFNQIQKFWRAGYRSAPLTAIPRNAVYINSNINERLYNSFSRNTLNHEARERQNDYRSSNWPTELRRQLTTTPNAEVYGEDWPEHEFTEVAEASLESISEQVSEIGDESANAPSDFDVELSQGVLTISMGSSGTYVINLQTPNRQIWMSSPASGPWRYAWSPELSAWLSTRDGHMLNQRLTDEFSDIFKENVQISFTDVSAV